MCRDASNPPADVENWIEEGRFYKLKGTTQSLNTDELCAIITDSTGKIIKPTKNWFGFKASRLVTMFELCKN